MDCNLVVLDLSSYVDFQEGKERSTLAEFDYTLVKPIST